MKEPLVRCRRPAGRPDRGSSRRAGAAFTLVEVLVVVAIIALLVAILLPSLKRAQDEARATVCASNMRQCAAGALTHLLESGMKKERWNTNFGWATQSLKVNKGQVDLFTCPTDTDPRPTPAVLARLNEGRSGTTSGDGIFNRTYRAGTDRWRTDIQDDVDLLRFGGDAYNDNEGSDLLLDYPAAYGQRMTSATVADKQAGFRFDVLSYEGGLIWENAQTGAGPSPVPLLWLSYSANASAGLVGVKGAPALLVEGGKPGVFPEQFVSDTGSLYKADNLPWSLRFRHGGNVQNPAMKGCDFTTNAPYPDPAARLPKYRIDARYEPRERMNVAHLDGHVERLGYWQMFDLTATPMPRPFPRVWFGQRTRSPFLSY